MKCWKVQLLSFVGDQAELDLECQVTGRAVILVTNVPKLLPQDQILPYATRKIKHVAEYYLQCKCISHHINR